MEVNVDLVLSQQNVEPVEVQELWILDKDLCKFKWPVTIVMVKEQGYQAHVGPVKAMEPPIEPRSKPLTYQRE